MQNVDFKVNEKTDQTHLSTARVTINLNLIDSL